MQHAACDDSSGLDCLSAVLAVCDGSAGQLFFWEGDKPYSDVDGSGSAFLYTDATKARPIYRDNAILEVVPSDEGFLRIGTESGLLAESTSSLSDDSLPSSEEPDTKFVWHPVFSLSALANLADGLQLKTSN